MYFDPALIASWPFLAIFSFFFFRLLKSFLSDHPKPMPCLFLKFSQLSTIIYCFKYQLLIAFSCPINRWNPNLFFPSWPLRVNFTLSLPQPIPLPFFFFSLYIHASLWTSKVFLLCVFLLWYSAEFFHFSHRFSFIPYLQTWLKF